MLLTSNMLGRGWIPPFLPSYPPAGTEFAAGARGNPGLEYGRVRRRWQ